MKKNCSCGQPLPYRRAYGCRGCWDGLESAIKVSMYGRRKYDAKTGLGGSLRLRQEVVKGR